LLSKRAENKSRIKRLKKNSDFLELRRKGLRLRTSEWLQIHFQKSKEEDLFIGVTTGRKVGSAVIRNRLKRWCLEYFRKHHKKLSSGEKEQSSLSGQLNVLFRPQKEGFYKELTHEELDQELHRTLSRLTQSR
jgi:ribonuclease P protein component